jgi:crotonobetainyl-CoA:carnitine CoA-transferase CaiB-like acyl-CoA transferase
MLGTFTLEGPRAKLSRTPALVRRAAPFLGQDNRYVLAELLGYDEDKITELVSSAVLG